jgi:hypothetical protein
MAARAKNSAAFLLALCLGAGPAVSAGAQIDPARADLYFRQVMQLCEHSGDRLWGVSLCGPMVIADPATGSIATSEPAPQVERPRALGFTNSVVEWGGVRWATYIWQGIPADDFHKRSRMMLHELFHRIQPGLGLMTPSGRNEHLDTLEGRYWLELEWRALGRALERSGAERSTAIRDALSFRQKRRETFPGAAENERLEEIREGLAQYTGTVVSAASTPEAVDSAVSQLVDAVKQTTFVRTFAYPSGVAYGVLLDAYDPGWTRRVRVEDDLGQLLMTAAGVEPADDLESAAGRYGAAELRRDEEKREAQRQVRIDELRRRFVDGPVLVLPGGGRAQLITSGATPIPGSGTYYSSYRVENDWGTLEATGGAVISEDGAAVIVPAPAGVDGATLRGEGWTVTLAAGWVVRPGPRPGDFRVVPESR